MSVVLILLGLSVIWIIPIFVIGVNDQSHPAARFAWCALVVPFSWLAVLVWSIVVNDRNERVRCAECAELIRREAKICPFCTRPNAEQIKREARAAAERVRAEKAASA